MGGNGVTSMSGGSAAPNRGPIQRRPARPAARKQAASGWDDVAAARNEVFGDDKDDGEDAKYEGPYRHQGS